MYVPHPSPLFISPFAFPLFLPLPTNVHVNGPMYTFFVHFDLKKNLATMFQSNIMSTSVCAKYLALTTEPIWFSLIMVQGRFIIILLEDNSTLQKKITSRKYSYKTLHHVKENRWIQRLARFFATDKKAYYFIL